MTWRPECLCCAYIWSGAHQRCEKQRPKTGHFAHPLQPEDPTSGIRGVPERSGSPCLAHKILKAKMLRAPTSRVEQVTQMSLSALEPLDGLTVGFQIGAPKFEVWLQMIALCPLVPCVYEDKALTDVASPLRYTSATLQG